MSDDEEVQAAVDAINLAIEGLAADVHVSIHICQGNYAVGKEYDAQIGHRYFDVGRYKADLVCKIEASSYLIEYDMTHHYKDHLGNRQLGVGAVDVQDPKIESGETIAARIRKKSWLAPEQTIVTSSCGFNHLPRHSRFRQAQGDDRSQADPRRMRHRDRSLLHEHREKQRQPAGDRSPLPRTKLRNFASRRASTFGAGCGSSRHLRVAICRAASCGSRRNCSRMYGLTEFDGRYEAWLKCVFREDRVRITN